MSPFRNLKLSSRINLVVAAILFLFFLLTLGLDYRHQQETIVEEPVGAIVRTGSPVIAGVQHTPIVLG